MKKIFTLLAIVVLTISLLGFEIDRIAAANTVHIAGETHPVLSSDGPSEKEAGSLTLSVQPVAFVFIGLECVLFGIIALSPLLIDDPALWRGAGIYLGETGFPHEPGGSFDLVESCENTAVADR